MGSQSLPAWLSFSGDLSVYVGLVLLSGAYAAGVGPLRVALGGDRRFPAGRAAAFFGGVFVILLALQSPLHALSEVYLLSAHMVQHMLLVLVAVPLLLLGSPAWLLRPLLRPAPVARVWRVLVQPVVAFTLYSGIFALSHLPLFYDLALRVHDLHVLQHLLYLSTAVLLWWPILSPLPEFPRSSPGAQLLYVFLQTIPAFGVGAIITFSRTVLYPTYAQAPRLFGLSPLADQELGGLIMWVGGAFYHLFVLTLIFFQWASREEAEYRPSRGNLAQRV